MYRILTGSSETGHCVETSVRASEDFSDVPRLALSTKYFHQNIFTHMPHSFLLAVRFDIYTTITTTPAKSAMVARY